MSDAIHYDVFLSYNRKDSAFVDELAARLRAVSPSIEVFLDKWSLQRGENWQPGIDAAIAASRNVAVCIGPHGLVRWQKEEAQIALMNNVDDASRLRVIPIIIPGGDPATASGSLKTRTWVDFRNGIDDAAFHSLVGAIRGEAADGGTVSLPDNPSPYRGLERFEEEHAGFFFGRDEDTSKVVNLLEAEDLVAITSASGTGKSSLARAGVLPDLAKGRIPGSEKWRVMMMEPGREPLHALATALCIRLPPADRDTAYQATIASLKNPGGLRQQMDLYFPGEVLLLFIDQFEEAITAALSHGAPGRAVENSPSLFFLNLANALSHGDRRLRILLTMRADFLEPALTFPEVRQMLQGRQYLLGEIEDSNLLKVITEPARAVGAFFENALPIRIIDNFRENRGALALLEDALFELWRHRRGVWLTHEAFGRDGGISGALQRRADRVYKRLASTETTGDHKPSSRQLLARRIFVRLTAFGEGERMTRRRVQRPELYPASADRGEVDAVVKSLSGPNARLITAGDHSVEVAHEVLIREWGLLRQWLEEDRRALRISRELTEEARKWDERERTSDLLYEGSQLLEAEEWATAHPMEPSVLEREFLDAAIASRDWESRQTLQEAEQRAEDAAAKSRLWRSFVGAILLAVVIAAAAGSSVYTSQLKATNQSKGALSRNYFNQAQRLLEVGKAHEALAILASACRIDSRNAVTASRLFALLTQRNWPIPMTKPLKPEEAPHTDESEGEEAGNAGGNDTLPPIEQVSYSPDGKFILGSTFEYSRAYVWNSTSGEQILDVGPCNTMSMNYDARPCLPGPRSFSSAGQLIVIHGSKLVLWDLTRRDKIGEQELDSEITAAQFSTDGKSILTGTENGTLYLWSDHLELQHSLATGGKIEAISFDGKRVLARLQEQTTEASDDCPPPLELLEVSPDWQSKQSIARSDKGKQFLGADELLHRIVTTTSVHGVYEAVELWDTSSGTATTLLRMFSEGVKDVGFDKAGSVLAVITVDTPLVDADVKQEVTSRLRVWDTKEGKLVAIATHDVHVFDPQDGFYPYKVCVSPDGSRVATVAQDRTLRLWDSRKGTAHFILPASELEFTSIAFSSDNARLLSGSMAGFVTAWDIRPTTLPPRGETLREAHKPTDSAATNTTLGEVPGSHDQRVFDYASAMAGRKLTGPDNNLKLVDTATGKVIREGISAQQGNALFSPSGSVFATVAIREGEGAFLRFWNSADGKPVRNELRLAEWNPKSWSGAAIAFDPNASRVGTVLQSFGQNRIDVIDTATVERLMDSIELDSVTDVELHEDGIRVFAIEDNVEKALTYQVGANSAPEWLADLANLVSGKRMTPEGAMEHFPVTPESVESFRKKLDDVPEKSDMIAWARWFLADRATRPARPDSTTAAGE